MTETGQSRNLTETAVLKVLAYFDIFQYPLKKAEIKQFLNTSASEPALETALTRLLAARLIFLHGPFYSLQNMPSSATRRTHGNIRAAMLLPEALKIGRFLYRFPFVRGIGISGSLSKNFADEKADIDFFVITAANRLWIARTLMHLFKKLAFLSGRQHYYCMNYYIDQEALLLSEQNIFTAIEIKTLLPVSGNQVMQEFFTVNDWATQWLPSCAFRKMAMPDQRKRYRKRMLEWLGNNFLGNIIDNWLMRLTNRRWRKKELHGKKNDKGQKMGLITGKHFSRSNPGGLQEKILLAYKQKLAELNIE